MSSRNAFLSGLLKLSPKRKVIAVLMTIILVTTLIFVLQFVVIYPRKSSSIVGDELDMHDREESEFAEGRGFIDESDHNIKKGRFFRHRTDEDLNSKHNRGSIAGDTGDYDVPKREREERETDDVDLKRNDYTANDDDISAFSNLKKSKKNKNKFIYYHD
uniref:Uncharacterized protein n=1 Tax=Panagrellus redivivus TaxID=6233 RepID=A0A7E4W3P2_PANRE